MQSITWNVHTLNEQKWKYRHNHPTIHWYYITITSLTNITSPLHHHYIINYQYITITSSTTITSPLNPSHLASTSVISTLFASWGVKRDHCTPSAQFTLVQHTCTISWMIIVKIGSTLLRARTRASVETSPSTEDLVLFTTLHSYILWRVKWTLFWWVSCYTAQMHSHWGTFGSPVEKQYITQHYICIHFTFNC